MNFYKNSRFYKKKISIKWVRTLFFYFWSWIWLDFQLSIQFKIQKKVDFLIQLNKETFILLGNRLGEGAHDKQNWLDLEPVLVRS
jgi:hypothetical protein